MYRRPKFLEILLEIRQEMALEADYDVDLFAERVRVGNVSAADVVDKPSANGDLQPAKTKAPVERQKSEAKLAKS
ncbi:MAG: hypothetical protein ABL952_00920 [Pyrinomonadaceae bacterium]